MSAFGGSAPQGGPSPFELDEPASREQAPETARPQPSVSALSAGAARVLAMPQAELAAHVEDLAMQALRAESRAAQAEAALDALRGTTKNRLATFNATGKD